ncbi:Immunoglobulin V-set, subgroup containing protein [Cricetulus griseus]|nr:Immunoglobulin V-set, subgroup containing protein [Cricetulus griseus]
MDSAPGVVTAIFLILGKTHAESVTQTEGKVTLSEEDFLTIHCNYSATGYPALFWYVQYPGEGPQLLFRASKANEKGSSRGFEATYDRESTSFHLQKASVQESDSAVYYCALGDTVTETTAGAEHKLSTRSLAAELLPLGMLWFLCTEKNLNLLNASPFGESSVKTVMHSLSILIVVLWLQLRGVNSLQGEENPWTLSIQEGESVTMNCSYKTSIEALQWYRQDSGKGPAVIILIRSNEKKKQSGRVRVTLNTSTQSSSLSIIAARPEDTAAYFCATEAQCAAGTCSPDTNPQSCFLDPNRG